MLIPFLVVVGKVATILCIIVAFVVISYLLIHACMSEGMDSTIEKLKNPTNP
jgi:hypothetical protein